MYYVVYGFLWLVSLLPFRVLYFLSDCMYGLMFYVFKYRKEVVLSNLAIAFPEKSEQERRDIAKKFYHNFLDAFVESIKFISISKLQIQKRSTCDFDLINQLSAKLILQLLLLVSICQSVISLWIGFFIISESGLEPS